VLLHNPFGPIFEKELRATSRRKRSYLLRVIYLGALLLLLLFAYAVTDGGRGFAGGGVAWRVQRQAMLGQVFFACFAIFSVGAMAMIAPVLTSTAISAERLHKTLHVLLMTPINAWQIVTGKLASRLLVALTLVGLSLPVLALVRLLGGTEVREMFNVIALVAATAICTASIGLLLSIFISRAYGVILFSYGSILFLYMGVPLLMLVPFMNNPAPPFHVFRAITIISPFFCVAFLVLPGGMMMTANWHWCVVGQLALSAGFVTASALLLRRMQRREGSVRLEDAPPPEPAAAVDASQDSALPPVPHAHRKLRRGREVGDNPVLWRELGRPLFNRKWQSIAAGIVFVALLVVSYMLFWAADALDDRELQGVYGVLFNGAMWLVIAVLAGTAIAQEKESDTWTLLLATPISGSRIVWGKVLGLARRMIWPILLIAAHFSVFAAAGVISWVVVPCVVWIIVSFNTLWIATGVLCSLLVRRVTFAVILNLSIAVVLYAVVPIALVIAFSLLEWDEELMEMCGWGIPYPYIVISAQSLSPEFDTSRTVYAPGGIYLTSVEFLLAIAIAGMTHVALAGAVIGLTVNRFNRIVGRARQTEPPPDLPADVNELGVVG
jgi:ABC-type transport system involved in multi-copper enzyme maturation permease subunit